MNGYRLSSLAKSDIAGILDYTVDTWGEAQAHLYLDALADCFGCPVLAFGIKKSTYDPNS